MFKNNVLLHRIPRIVKASWPTFLGLLLIVFFLSYAVTAFSARSDIITTKVTEMANENNVEDGCFDSVFKLKDSEINKIKDLNVQIQENFSVSFALDNSTLRVFKTRENIDLVALDDGSYPNKGEIVLEKLYAKYHNYNIGSTIKIGDKSFTVSGIGSSPDYDKVKEEINEQFKDDTSDLLKKAFAAKVMEKQKDSITLDVLDEWENPIVRDVNIRGDEVSNDIHVGDLISLVD